MPNEQPVPLSKGTGSNGYILDEVAVDLQHAIDRKLSQQLTVLLLRTNDPEGPGR